MILGRWRHGHKPRAATIALPTIHPYGAGCVSCGLDPFCIATLLDGASPGAGSTAHRHVRPRRRVPTLGPFTRVSADANISIGATAATASLKATDWHFRCLRATAIDHVDL